MKAFVIRNQGKGIEAWKLVERPDPKPGPGEVLVRVRAASLNYRDLMIASGVYGGPLKDDLVPLADGAGEVAALGDGVTRWKIGDRVAGAYFPTWQGGPMRPEYFERQVGARVTDGWLAESIVLPESGLVRLPDYLSFEEAATLPCAAVTAWVSLFEAAVRPKLGSTIVVLGTGGVSLFAAQLALAEGLRVIATTSSNDKAEKLRKLGVRDIINYRETPEWHEEVLRLTGGEGADHILEVGGAGTLPRSLQAVRFAGTVTLLGFLTGTDLKVDPLPVLFRASRLEGVVVGSVQSFEAMNRGLEATKIRPVVDEVFPFERATEALAKMKAATHFGKIVVRVA
ncbi:zinc-dependent alcohol dehydrogenase family protein [Labilithrix luteola]|nr:NAD(P)-dependent alcohol dehydrogenase [Labilithrix luteola]